jgi:hypothetical protein
MTEPATDPAEVQQLARICAPPYPEVFSVLLAGQ